MNVDNQTLTAIKKQKAEIKKEMRDCYNMERLFELDKQYSILCEEETEILNRSDIT